MELGLDLSSRYTISDMRQAFSVEHLFDLYPDFHESVYGRLPDWFQQIKGNLETQLIHTQRLKGDILWANTFRALYDKDLEESVISSHASPTLEDLSFRFLYQSDGDPNFDPAFFEDLENLEVYRKLAMKEARLLGNILEDSATNERLAEKRQELQSLAQTIRSRYEDSEPHRSMLLFMDIINERFLFKSFQVQNNEDGFNFLLDNGQDVPLSSLSSGERHFLILSYRLVFEVEPDTLVMVDEPELSMNVVWQRNFLKDLQRIVELRKFDVLIATHSPQIIHDKWDWVVHLGEKVDD